MDTRSASWPKIKRASIKIVVCVYGPSSITVMAQDKKSIYQNSGVCVRAVINYSHDDDDTETDTYYGKIEEIWELDYVGLKGALFRCRCLTNGKRAVSKDKNGYVSVDLRVFGYKNELFVFANNVVMPDFY
jgi:hypothetical protein